MEQTQPPEPLLTLMEAASIARVSDVTARKLIATEWSPFCLKIGRLWKVSASGLDGWIKGRMATGGVR